MPPSKITWLPTGTDVRMVPQVLGDPLMQNHVNLPVLDMRAHKLDWFQYCSKSLNQIAYMNYVYGLLDILALFQGLPFAERSID